MLLKRLGTSGSPPRMPCSPVMVAFTERSWIPRSWATEATPPVRQAPSATSRISTGVAPWSSEENCSGWSASNVKEEVCSCSSPSPKNVFTVPREWVPLTHSVSARHWNWAPAGVSESAVRAPRRKGTSTPLSTAGVSVVVMGDSFLSLLLLAGTDHAGVEPGQVQPAVEAGVFDLEAAAHHHGQARGRGLAGDLRREEAELQPERLGADVGEVGGPAEHVDDVRDDGQVAERRIRGPAEDLGLVGVDEVNVEIRAG